MAAAAPRVVGRFRGLSAEDGVDEAVDRALAEAGFEVVDVALPGWEAASTQAYTLLLSEAWAADRALIEATGGEGVSEPIQARLQLGAALDDAAVARSWAAQSAWQEELAEVFRRVEVIALPTLVRTPPRVDAAEETHLTTATVPFNFSGHPGLALPVPRPGAPVPASLQLVGPHGSEDLLLAAGAVVEAAVG
jgi:amidase